MIRIQGTCNHADCFCNTMDDTAFSQIRTICDQPAFAGSRIRIMPDVHAGKGCTIGTTMTITDRVVPGMVGVDIGCGMDVVRIDARDVDFPALDTLIRGSIPGKRTSQGKPHAFADKIDLGRLRCAAHVDMDVARCNIGTLGGGNHFIELDRDEQGNIYLVIHSGSRRLGSYTAEYYQSLAAGACGDTMPPELAYITGAAFEDYIHDMKIVQQYAQLNRDAMVDNILRGMGWQALDRFTTVHNYIDTDAMILRKGAVSARAGQKLLIPINMRDGSLICTGKGNPDWNQSAPHGAGRLMTRSRAADTLSLEDYQAAMQGIYTSCISQKTLDESPMAYKSMDQITGQIDPTVQIDAHIRPIFNFKYAN